MMNTSRTAFVDLSAAYDTVNHRILTRKLYEMMSDVRLTQLICNMLSSRRFFVDLNGSRSRWRTQKNGLPQGSVLAPLLFNIYTNDQPTQPDTRRFLYADDLCIASQKSTFEAVEVSLSNALDLLIPYYSINHLRANPGKTQICAFHLKNREAERKLQISWYGKRLQPHPLAFPLYTPFRRPLLLLDSLITPLFTQPSLTVDDTK
uniref:Reverse transcriptase domain-containing protein n=1 Tax=Hippocampus comes TaxID=109280 RepID=A0A3Q2YP85_HIPCM